MAGPRRPQDRVALPHVWTSFVEVFEERLAGPSVDPARQPDDDGYEGLGTSFPEERLHEDVPQPAPADAGTMIDHGSVVIAAITSCTNTSNPSVMVAAGLLAKKAVDAGLASKPWVKTSL